MFEWLGEQNNPNTHEYIRIEIESILSQDPRIKSVTADIEDEVVYMKTGLKEKI